MVAGQQEEVVITGCLIGITVGVKYIFEVACFMKTLAHHSIVAHLQHGYSTEVRGTGLQFP